MLPENKDLLSLKKGETMHFICHSAATQQRVSMRLLLGLFMALLASLSAAPAQAQQDAGASYATLLNPQNDDVISRFTNPGYRLNGACLGVDEIYVYIYNSPTFSNANRVAIIPAKVFNGTWSAEWIPGGTGVFHIAVVPVKRSTSVDGTEDRLIGTFHNAINGTIINANTVRPLTPSQTLNHPQNEDFNPSPNAQTLSVTVIDNLPGSTDPDLGLDISPGDDPAGVFLRPRNTGADLQIPTAVRFVRNSAGQLILRLGLLTNLTPQLYRFPSNAVFDFINHGVNLSSSAVAALPGVVSLGADSNFAQGLLTIGMDYVGGVNSLRVRRVISDRTAPGIDQAAALERVFLGGTTPRPFIRVTGRVSDPPSIAFVAPNNTINNNIISRVYAVIRRIQPTVGNPTVFPVTLFREANGVVQWNIDAELISFTTGYYSFRVFAVDGAGNEAEVASNLNPPGGVLIDATAPTVTVTVPSTVPPAGTKVLNLAIADVTDPSLAGVTYRVYTSDPGANFDAGYVASGNAASSVSVSVPVRDLSDGSRTLYVLARDAAGNVSTVASANVDVDNTAPILTVGLPPDGNKFFGGTGRTTITVAGNLTDTVSGAADIRVEIFVDNPDPTFGTGFAIGGNGTGSGYSLTIPASVVSTLTDGSHTLTVLARDAALNISKPGSIPIVIDTVRPSASFNAVGTLVRDTVDISGTLSDNNTDPLNVLQWSLAVPGVGNVTGLGMPFRYAWLTPMIEGTRNLTVTVTDQAGNSFTSPTFPVTIDNVNPAPTLNPVPAVDAIIGGTINLSGNYGDTNPNTLAFLLDGIVLPNGTLSSPTTTYPWDTTLVSDGKHELSLLSTDLVGRTGRSATRSVVVDNTAPAITIVPPTDNVLTVGKTVTAVIRDAHLDQSSIRFIFTRLAGGNPNSDKVVIIPRSTPTASAITFQTISDGVVRATVTLPSDYDDGTPLAAGVALRLRVEAEDTTQLNGNPNTNNSSASTADLNSLGASTLALTGIQRVSDNSTVAPIKGKAFLRSGRYKILGSVSVSDLDSWRLVANKDSSPTQEDVIVDSDEANSPDISVVADANAWDVSNLSEGIWTLTLSATTNTGATVPATTLKVVIDKFSPNISFISPIKPPNLDIYLSSSVKQTTVKASVEDRIGDLPNERPTYTISIGAGANPNITSDGTVPANEQVELPFNTNGLGEGPRTITIEAKDLAGNVKTERLSFISDNIAPAVSGFSPTESVVRGTVPITGTVVDANPDTAQIFINNDDRGIQRGSTFTYNWSTIDEGRPENAPFTIKIELKDKAGNQATFQQSISVDNTAPRIQNVRPASTPNVAGDVNVSFDIIEGNPKFDTSGSPATYTLFINGVKAKGGAGVGLVYNWNTREQRDGTHTVRIAAEDALSNSSETTATYTVDNTGPGIDTIVVAPRNGVNVSGTVTVTTRVSDKSFDAPNGVSYRVFVVRLPEGTERELQRRDNLLQENNSVLAEWITTQEANGNYLIRVRATDARGNASVSDSTLIVVANAFPTSLLDLRSPVGVDEYGTPLPANTTQTQYVGGNSFTIGLGVRDADGFAYRLQRVLNGVPFVPDITGTVPVNPPTQTYTVPAALGRNFFTLTATSPTGTSSPAQVDIVLDNIKPVTTIRTPSLNSNQPLPQPPGSLVTLVFDVENTTPSGIVPSPLRRISRTVNAPLTTLTITNLNTGAVVMVPGGLDLAIALTQGNLNEVNGAASLSGDAFGKYTVNWQLRLDARYFTIGHRYEVKLSGIQDVVRNTADPKTAYFVIRVN